VTGLHKENVIISYILGFIAFTSGISGLIGLSPIFISTIAGLTFANLSMRKEYVFGVLAHREHTVYILLLVLAGAICELTIHNILWLIVLLFSLRIFIKLFLGIIALNLVGIKKDLKESPFILSLSLIPHGGMPVALALSFYLAFDTPFPKQLFMAVLTVILLNEFVQPFIIKRIREIN